MPYTVRREVRDGELVRLSLGIGLVDDYLDFLRCHARPNTWLNYAHDLKVFFSLVDKPVAAVTTADVLHFMACQRSPPPPPIRTAIRRPGPVRGPPSGASAPSRTSTPTCSCATMAPLAGTRCRPARPCAAMRRGRTAGQRR